jgi:hypothetical protein
MNACRLVVLIALAALQLQATGAPTACRMSEETVFSCPSGLKQIAVCASRKWSAQSGFLQYRYGSRKQAEIVVPHQPDTMPASAATVGRRALSGGGYEYLRFRAGEFRYTVYSAVSGKWGLKSGVVVEKGEKQVVVRRCTRGMEGEFASGLFDRRGQPSDDSDFLLPD